MNSKNHANYFPCSKCKAPTTSGTGQCNECRKVNCAECRKPFSMRVIGESKCSDCRAKRRNKSRTWA